MRTFISILLIVNLLVSTVGVQLHRIYCYCTGNVTVLLWHPGQMACKKESACAQAEAIPLPCSNDNTDHTKLCCKPSGDRAALADGISKSCGTENHIFTKLKIDLKNQHLSFGIDFGAAVCVPQQAIFSVFLLPLLPQKGVLTASPRGPPQRPFGKQLLPYIQSWLC